MLSTVPGIWSINYSFFTNQNFEESDLLVYFSATYGPDSLDQQHQDHLRMC